MRASVNKCYHLSQLCFWYPPVAGGRGELRNHYSGITAEGLELWLFVPHFGSSSGSTCNFPAGSFRASPQTNAFKGSPRVSVQPLTLHSCLLLPDGTGWSDAPAEHSRPGVPLSYSDSSSRQVPNPPVHTRGKLGHQACGNLWSAPSLAWPMVPTRRPAPAVLESALGGHGSASRGLGFNLQRLRSPLNLP